jgi:hypothetical protein
VTEAKRERESKMDRVEEKLDRARGLIQEHNQMLADLGVKPFDADEVLRKIRLQGGTSEARLRRFSYEDILTCFFISDQTQSLPTVLAKEIAALFRDEDGKKRPVGVSRAERMIVEELLAAFDPDEPGSPVGRRLKEISKGKAFLVYDESGGVDIKTSRTLLAEVRGGYAGRREVLVDGTVRPVHKVGETPDRLVEENPLYPGRPLRPDGTCDQTGRSWQGIPLAVRQFLRLGVGDGVLKITTVRAAHDLIDEALQDEALVKLQARYRAVALRFNALKKEGKLPTLRLRLANEPWEGGLGGDGREVDWDRRPL